MPWRHPTILFDKLSGAEVRLWYAVKAVEHDWSERRLDRRVAVSEFERDLHDVPVRFAFSHVGLNDNVEGGAGLTNGRHRISQAKHLGWLHRVADGHDHEWEESSKTQFSSRDSA